MDRNQLLEHLAFARELGVDGISRDPEWRRRDARGGPRSPVVAAVRSRSGLQGSCGCAVRRPCRHRGLHALQAPSSGAEADRLRRGKPIGSSDVRRRGAGRRRRRAGHSVRRACGQLLREIIEAIGLTRDEVYIANVIKCRPPQNRNPEPDEVDTCEPFLFQQVDIISPRVIVALGTFAARTLLRTLDPISRLRGRVYEYRGAKLIPTFHPAYLLRNPASKREVWEDMKVVRSLLQT